VEPGNRIKYAEPGRGHKIVLQKKRVLLKKDSWPNPWVLKALRNISLGKNCRQYTTIICFMQQMYAGGKQNWTKFVFIHELDFPGDISKPDQQ
jgi:hypothetical protein